MLRNQGFPLLSIASRRRLPTLIVLFIPLVVLYYQLFHRYDTRPGSNRSRINYPGVSYHDDTSEHAQAASNVSVNLVIASLQKDDISWTDELSDALPNLQVIRYISDFSRLNPPEFHPSVPKKGREASIYHTYMHDFYHTLPDVSIFVHADDQPWHMDGVLQQSLLFTLKHLDISRLEGRGGYANLRVSWEDSCPAWIDTTLSAEESTKKEEPFMRTAFMASFKDTEVPPTFAGPCCAQFAVTREAIHRNKRTQYARSKAWLAHNKLSNYIAGRTWEHMWPWLFLHNAPEPFQQQATKDCPAEWNAYCSMYGICFGGSEAQPDPAEAVRSYNERWAEKESLRRDHLEEWWNRLLHPLRAATAMERISELEEELDAELLVALERGRDQALRDQAFAHLFAN